MENDENSGERTKGNVKTKVASKIKLLQLQYDAAREYAAKYRKLSENRQQSLPDFDEDQNIVPQSSGNENDEASAFFPQSVAENPEECNSNLDPDESDSNESDSNEDTSDNFNNFNDGNYEQSSFLESNNTLMFPQSGLQVNDVIEMLMGYFIQFGLVEEARIKLINIIKILAGPLFKNLEISNYMLNKVMDAPPDNVIFHYYCKECEKEVVHSSVKSGIKGQKKICQQCQSKNKITLNNNKYFLTVNFEYQLQLLLKNKEIRDHLVGTVYGNNKRDETSDIRDIQDSKLYKETKIKFPNTITYNLSTDGAPVSMGKSGVRSFWPLSVIINDLPPEIRFKHILLVGMMMVTSEPPPHLMKLFIDKFKEDAFRLHTIGLLLELAKNYKIKLTFTILCIIADSVARAVLQYRMQYSGYCSCTYCYQLGFYFGYVRFPFIGSKCEVRTHDSHMSDVYLCEKNGKAENGVKGRSSFCSFPNVDMARSFSLDFMHNGVLGVAEQMWKLMKKNLTPVQRSSVEHLLTLIQPPRELHRKPEKLSKLGDWKATNWKAWLFYYSVPLLLTVVSENFPIESVEYYALFVNAMYTLSKTKISRDDLVKSKKDLLKFVSHVETTYGLSAMTFNIHLLLHAIENVIDTGPCWSTSAFPYESNIFILKSSVNGPKAADQQMIRKSLQRLLYKFRPRDHLPDIVKEVCESFLTEKRYTPSAKSVGNVTLFGFCESDDFPRNYETYERCSYKGMILTTAHYSRNETHNDSAIKLEDNSVAQILNIFVQPNGLCFLKVQQLIIEPLFINHVKMEHIWKVLPSPSNHKIINFSAVQSKMIVLDLDSIKIQYLCSMPNCFEKQ
ncbi:uncharacterized protein LOC127287612 [Leptopilina boulardi]|uniref:uncharacterized protein LOC127287612 n=1 Tax=Leptopilina boulardi TaxID=63433 RepID=UPI0021F68D85|nr:uncharacterized protein LOC127287612 [Leptopilina boulardi]